MAITPSVVPIASTSFSEPVIAVADGSVSPWMAANASIVPMTTRLLRMGANMGTAKRRWALSRPVATAPTP